MLSPVAAFPGELRLPARRLRFTESGKVGGAMNMVSVGLMHLEADVYRSLPISSSRSAVIEGGA